MLSEVKEMKKVKLLSGFMGILMGIMGTCSVSASPVENSVSQKDCYAKVSEQKKERLVEKLENWIKMLKIIRLSLQ